MRDLITFSDRPHSTALATYDWSILFTKFIKIPSKKRLGYELTKRNGDSFREIGFETVSAWERNGLDLGQFCYLVNGRCKSLLYENAEVPKQNFP